MAKILIVDDDAQMQLAIKATLSRVGFQTLVARNGKEALLLLDKEAMDLIISDQRMPEMGGMELLSELKQRDAAPPFIIITAHGTITQAVEAMQAGAADFLTKPFSPQDLTRVVAKVLQEAQEPKPSRQRTSSSNRPIITNDPVMIRTLEVAEVVARSDATVLIQGESGTGKELIARLIHAASSRSSHSFVAVNCAALPETLLESELFGHEKGAFTGAHSRKIGKFELAHGGTILLDEISEMDLLLQAKLLRVLQEREVDRIGGKDPIAIDVRVLATTNRRLELMVQEGKFRADLYYRLNVIPLTLPPLRARRSDVRLLIEHFMRRYLGGNHHSLPSDVLHALESHPWPGNIRELQNAVERAAILSRGSVPTREDFFLFAEERDSMFTLVGPRTPLVVSGGISGSSGGERFREDETLAGRIEKTKETHDEGSYQNAFHHDEVSSNDVHDTLGNVHHYTGAEQSSVVAYNGDSLAIRPGMTVHEVEKKLILQTLHSTGNNRTQAAKMLGISIRTLRNKLHEYGTSSS